MKRSAAFFFILGLFLHACGSTPPASTPVATKFPTVAPQSEVSSPEPTQQALSPILLHAGYGVDGGWFELYFTNPANPAAKQDTGGPDGPLAAAIDAAHLSVDAAMYSLSLDTIRRALIHAWQRGVQVRVVMESDNIDRPGPQALKDAGIPVLGDRREGLMHDKFFVIDRSEVWTGSMNLSNEGAYSDNNNLIRIRSNKVADDYETEFNEMFVDDKFGPDNAAVTPNPRVIVDGTPLDVYFSPHDHVQSALTDLISNAQSSIYFLAYSFTADPLGDAIRQRAAAGITVEGVMEAEQVASNIGTEFDAFHAAGLDIRLDGNPGQMHHKVMIIDKQIVVTGSYNFSASAEQVNDENLLVIYSPQIAAEFMREFQHVYATAQP